MFLPSLIKRDMKLTVLGSGSTGNGYILQNEQEALIIECGVNYRHAVEALENNVNKVSGCLVTHGHGDHASFIKRYARCFNVYASKGTFDECGVSTGAFHYCQIPLFVEFKVGNFVVKAFDTEHDAKEPCGFIIYHEEFGNLLFLTDTHHVKYRFNFPLDHIMIECNHTSELVDKSVKNGIIPPKVGLRAKATHMSLNRCLNILAENELQSTKSIVLIHMSKNNGNEVMFANKVMEATGKPVYVAKKNLELSLLR